MTEGSGGGAPDVMFDPFSQKGREREPLGAESPGEADEMKQKGPAISGRVDSIEVIPPIFGDTGGESDIDTGSSLPAPVIDVKASLSIQDRIDLAAKAMETEAWIRMRDGG